MLAPVRCDTRPILKRGLEGFNSEFFFKTSEELSFPYDFPIAMVRITGLIYFPRVSLLYEMQTVSPRVLTWVFVPLSYSGNHYGTCGFIYICIYIVIHRQICFVLSELISVGRQYLPVAGIETRLTQTPSQSF